MGKELDWNFAQFNNFLDMMERVEADKAELKSGSDEKDGGMKESCVKGFGAQKWEDEDGYEVHGLLLRMQVEGGQVEDVGKTPGQRSSSVDGGTAELECSPKESADGVCKERPAMRLSLRTRQC